MAQITGRRLEFLIKQEVDREWESDREACGGYGPNSAEDEGGRSGESHTDDSRTGTPRLCAVCGGLATGYHYGIASCEACKAFFKRTVQGNLSYACAENRECEVYHGKKRTCQACRYAKCIKEGMQINCVRPNRNKGGRQEYRRKPDEHDFAPIPTKKRKRKKTNTLEFCNTLLDIEPQVLKVNLPGGKWYEWPQPTSKERTPMEKLWMELMAEVADRALTNTVQWAKKIPGFDKLCLNDQMALLSNSWMEILLSNVIYRSTQLPASKATLIYFADGFILTKEMAYKGVERSRLMYNQIANIVERLRELKVSKGIMVLLKTIILFNCGPSLANRFSLQSPAEVQGLQSTAYDALHYRIHQEHPKDFRLVYRLLMILPLIKDVAVTVATVVWVEFNKQQVYMQQLLSEVVQPIIRTKMRRVTADGKPYPAACRCCGKRHDSDDDLEMVSDDKTSGGKDTR